MILTPQDNITFLWAKVYYTTPIQALEIDKAVVAVLQFHLKDIGVKVVPQLYLLEDQTVLQGRDIDHKGKVDTGGTEIGHGQIGQANINVVHGQIYSLGGDQAST